MYDGTVTAATIQAQLAKIVGSPVFARSDRLKRFLSFTVDAVLDGTSATLKEHTIGVTVYGREITYDVRLDPIVRVEAARLRAKLREYYETDGSLDRLLIEIPKGGYVAVWRWRPVQGGTPERAHASIAVLPFTNLTGNASDDYFSDGLTEELIHVIGRTTGLRVVARTSVFYFKGRVDDVRAIGARLDASLVLEGSVRRSDDRVRIAAHLIDASDGCEIWTGTFERGMTDVMRMQDELAAAIAAALRVVLRDGSSHHGVVDPNAHDAYLRARHLYNRRTVAAVERALALFEQSLSIQPDHHPARAGAANCHGLLAYWEIDKPYHLERSVTEARAALAAGIDLAEAHIPLAYARIQKAWDWNGAEFELLSARTVDPGSADIHHLYAYLCLLPTGRFELALESLERALRLDPLSCDVHASIGRALTLAGRPEAALTRLHAGLELDQSFREIHWQIGLAHERSGNYDAALIAFARAGELSEAAGAVGAGTFGHCLAQSGRQADARRLLRPDLDPAPRALVLLGLGEIEPALHALEIAVERRHRLTMWLKVDPRFRPLHGHPRYETLLNVVGLQSPNVGSVSRLQ